MHLISIRLLLALEFDMLFEYSDDNGGHLSSILERYFKLFMRKRELSELNWMTLAWVMMMKCKQLRSYLRQKGIHTR